MPDETTHVAARLLPGADEPIHWLTLEGIWMRHTARHLFTDCGITTHVAWLAEEHEVVTCEPCLEAIRGPVVDEVERVLEEARRAVPA